MKTLKLFKVSLAVMAVTLSASFAHAAGFQLGNQGSRAMGRANAVVADPKDASTIFYNPAGLTALDGKFNLYLGAIVIDPSFKYKDFDGNNKTDGNVNPLVSGHFYLGGKVLPWLSVGLGFNPNEGATVKWPANSPASNVVREQSARSLWFMPTLAVDFGAIGIKGLSIGATADLVYSYAYLTQDIGFGGGQTGRVALSGNDFKVGGHFGVLYKPELVPGLAIGATYRLPVRNTLKGTADFDAPAAVRGQLPPDGKGVVDGLDYPQYAVFGAGYTFFERFNLEVDGVWTNWRDFTRLQFTFPDGSQSTTQRLWHNTLGIRTGIEYRNQGVFAVRAGFEYDPTPVPKKTLDFALPDVNRDNLSAGFTIFLPADLWIDVGGYYLVGKSRSTPHTPSAIQPVVGIYHVSAYEVGASLGWALGKVKEAPKEVVDAPVKDTDGDGVPDATDACPMVAGTDGTGCPVPVDADNDGVLDNVDKCPGVTGVPPDGCPPLTKMVTVSSMPTTSARPKRVKRRSAAARIRIRMATVSLVLPTSARTSRRPRTATRTQTAAPMSSPPKWRSSTASSRAFVSQTLARA